MSNAGALITIAVFLAIVSTAAFFSIRLGWHREKQRLQEQEKAARVALELSPAYQAKVAADRQYELTKQRQQVET